MISRDQIVIISEQNNTITFEVHHTNFTQVNQLRRTLLSKIPALAIDKVDIHENTSEIHDEMLIHRLGLIPIDGDLKKHEGTTLTLHAEGKQIVYSNELKGYAKPLYDNIVIVSLGKKQTLKLTAYLKKGIGSDHTKYSTVIAPRFVPTKKDGVYQFTFESIGISPVELLYSCF